MVRLNSRSFSTPTHSDLVMRAQHSRVLRQLHRPTSALGRRGVRLRCVLTVSLSGRLIWTLTL